jgi:hypothetical protein
VKLFAKLFGKSAREGSDNATAVHRAQPDAEGQRPLFRDQVAGAGGDIPEVRARRLLTLRSPAA